MTTGLLPSITEELVAELEALASECGQHGANWYEPRHMAAFPEYACDQDFVIAASPATILALLAERAELKRNAERYRWLRQSMWYVGPDNFFCGEGGDMNDYENHNYLATNLDAAIDAAMQSEAKP